MGLALGAALLRRGAIARLSYIGRRAEPPPHPVFTAGSAYSVWPATPPLPPAAVLLAVPDSAIVSVTRQLAGELPPRTPVLHTSGAAGTELLGAAADLRHPTGTMHPLVALADTGADAERLTGAWFAVEGEPEARALAERLVRALEGRVLAIAPGSKALYHAAAVFASNYLVSLLAVAERLAAGAGVEEKSAREALISLARGALENVSRSGPAAALTGPLARGDHETVRAHLSALSARDRAIYSVLARETLALARERGLPPGTAEAIEEMLAEDG